MIIELIAGTVGMLGVLSGLGALVFWKKNGNGNGKHRSVVSAEPLTEADIRRGQELLRAHPEYGPAPVQVQWPPEMAELLERLNHPLVQTQPPWPEIVSELERITQRVLVAAKHANDPPPEWATVLASDLAANEQRLARIAADLNESIADGMVRFYSHVSQDLTAAVDLRPLVEISQRLEAIVDAIPKATPQPDLTAEVARQLADLPARMGQSVSETLASLTGQIRELVDIGRKKEEKKQFSIKEDQPPATPVTSSPPATPVTSSPVLAPPSNSPQSKSVQRAAKPIVLEEFNTITLEEFTVYELHPIEQGVFSANVLNLGPGWLYMRENDEPTIGDPKATTLPPGVIDNEIRVAQRLYVLASADGSITVRLMH